MSKTSITTVDSGLNWNIHSWTTNLAVDEIISKYNGVTTGQDTDKLKVQGTLQEQYDKIKGIYDDINQYIEDNDLSENAPEYTLLSQLSEKSKELKKNIDDLNNTIFHFVKFYMLIMLLYF